MISSCLHRKLLLTIIFEILLTKIKVLTNYICVVHKKIKLFYLNIQKNLQLNLFQKVNLKQLNL